MPQSQPLVSVIIPCFNEERFLADAIESLGQTYGHWELLVVDDGSTDGSSRIARDFATRHAERIRYLTHDRGANRGACASRNLGVAEARGELIGLLDADDVWLPAKLSRQTAILGRHPEVAMLVDATEYWYDWDDSASATGASGHGTRKNNIRPVGAPQDRVFGPGELMTYLYPLARGTAPCPSSLLIQKSIVEKLGGFEEEFTKEYQLYEDQAFLCKVYLAARTYVSGECHARYRQHAASVSALSAAHYHKVRHFFLDWLERYIEEHGIEDPAVDRLLRRALLRYRSPLLYRVLHKAPARIAELLRGNGSAANRNL
jgi:glycosyltransferase involved in cell wall biosynthesis